LRITELGLYPQRTAIWQLILLYGKTKILNKKRKQSKSKILNPNVRHIFDLAAKYDGKNLKNKIMN